jgi:dienelactone hydrolase
MRSSVKLFCVLSALSAASAVKSAEPLPGTKPLTEEGNLSAKQVAGMHKYLDRALAEAPNERAKLWQIDGSLPEAYAKSVEPNRERLRKMLGVVNERAKPKLEVVADLDTNRSWSIPGGGTVRRVRWAVLPGVDAEGLLLDPPGPPLANVVVVPPADLPPEAMSGVLFESNWFAAQLAEQGCRVLLPTAIDRKDALSANPKLNRATNIPHREFVHRMAYEMGRTLTGYEVQKVLAAADWFARTETKIPLAAAGYGDGGATALYAAALDTRFSACLVSGDFGSRAGDISEQPIDRNAWGLLREFGDAELGMLVAPRKLLIDNSPAPKWDGPVAGKGRGGAAPGKLEPIPEKAIRREIERLKKAVPIKWEPVVCETGKAVEILVTAVGKKKLDPRGRVFEGGGLGRPFPEEDILPRHTRQFDQLVAYTQKLWRDSDAARKAFWAKADATSPEAWERSCDWYRDYFHTEVIGKLPEPTVPLNPRTRRVYDEKTWTGYEVVLDVYSRGSQGEPAGGSPSVSEDVFAYGILLLPKDLKPGERRPVVVCQHGLEGTPRDTIEPERRPTYNHFARRLVELGYIVYAPQNPYYGRNGFRQLQRKANPLKLSLFSFIIRQHQRHLDWLETLPHADPKRIAFYGLSYGGKTAMRVPAVEKRYCLSVCSGDFNEWIGKNVSVDLDRSYMWTGEYEMYEFDLGNTFNYAEMAYLIAPRPFMVERGHDDGVGTDEMVASEYAKVRYLYANRLKIPERTAIEFFAGGHQINGKGTFAFLKEKLAFPK